MTDPSKMTPQDHIRQLEAAREQASAPAISGPGPARTCAALDWAIPLLRAMHEPPPNPEGLDMIGILESIGNNRPIAVWQAQAMVEWASPILRSYMARVRLARPTKNTPGSNVANLRLMAEGKAVPWDLAQTALDWALPILEASMATQKDRDGEASILEECAKALEPSHDDSRGATTIGTAVRHMRIAANMLRAPAPSSSRFSAEERKETAWFIKSREIHPNTPDYEAAIYGRAADMISERPSSTEAADSEIKRLAEFILEKFPHEPGKWDLPNGESAVDVAIRLLSVQSSESMRQHADKIRRISNDVTADGSMLRSELREAAMILQGLGISFEELEKLESFIEEKFPGELNGNGPATVAIRLLRSHRSIDSSDELEAHRILGGEPGESILDVARRVVRSHCIPEGEKCSHCNRAFANMTNGIHMLAKNYTCKECYSVGKRPYKVMPVRLPTLDAPQIPVTRDLALEVLRGFLVTMQRAYPYAPSPSPEQWATARKALMFVLANDAQHGKAWEELGAIRDLFLAIPGETTVEAARRSLAILRQCQSDRDLAWAETRKIQSILGCKVDEFPIATAERVASELKQAQKDLDAIRAMMPQQGQESLVETVAIFSRYLTTVMATLGYSNPLPKIEDIQSAIEEAKNPNPDPLTLLEVHGWAYRTICLIEDAEDYDDPMVRRMDLMSATIQSAWDHRRPG